MAKKESVQKRLQKVRPPRVQMTYDVEIGDDLEQKELPFVVGVVGEFAGKSLLEQEKLKDKKFVQIDQDNFDDVMKGMQPRAAFQVENHLTPEGGTFGVDLTFEKMEDFRPEVIVERVESLKKLLEARTKLADLRNKLAGNDKLEDLLADVLKETDALVAIKEASER